MHPPWQENGLTAELSGTVIGCHLSNKSVSQISALLYLSRSTLSNFIVKWKRLGETTAQPRSRRPHKLTEWDCRLLKHTAHRNRLSSVVTLTTEFQTATGSSVSTRTVRRELYGRADAHKPKMTMRNAKRRLELWLMFTANGLWSSGNAFSGVMNHASPSGSPTDESGFGGCQENATYPNA
jgi:transposase